MLSSYAVIFLESRAFMGRHLRLEDELLVSALEKRLVNPTRAVAMLLFLPPKMVTFEVKLLDKLSLSIM